MAKRKNNDDLYGRFDLFSMADAHPEYFGNDSLGLIIEKAADIDRQVDELQINLLTADPAEEVANENIKQIEPLKQFNNIFTDLKLDQVIELGGEKDRFSKNVEAIKLTNEIYPKLDLGKKGEIELNITKEQQLAIASFSGWGGINGLFDERNEKWQNERNELKELLSEDDYNAAKRSNLTAYYTPKNIVKAMYNGLEKLGINTDEPNLQKKILEPSVGNGSFITFNENKNFHFTGLDIEPLTIKMNKILYPNQQNYNIGYEKFRHDEQFDAVIGNPPFLDVPLYDNTHHDIFGSAHNFFIQKATQYSLKEDGISAFVVSRHFMDAKYNSARDEIAQNHTFLGAVRLPNNIFKHTEAETDIIFLQKGKHPEYNKEISKIKATQITEDGIELKQSINQYFIENPQNILAKPTYRTGQFGKGIFYEPKNDENFNLDLAIEHFIQEQLPANIYKWREPAPIVDFIIESYDDNYEYVKNLKENSLFIHNGEVCKITSSLGDEIRASKVENLSLAVQNRIKKYIPLRDKLKELIALEQTNIKDDDLKLWQTREQLNILLDSYHASEGFLSGNKASAFRNLDIEFSKVKALEKNYKKSERAKDGKEAVKESCEKANILLRRTIGFTPEILFDNEKDGVLVSMYQYGKIDTDYIAQKLNKSKIEVEDKIIEDKLAFYDPQKLINGERELIFAPIYLSGNVKEKLQIAKDLQDIYTDLMQNNVNELSKVIPQDISFVDIDTRFGSSWIPVKYYNDFLEHELKTSNYEEQAWKLKNLGSMGWQIDGDKDYFSQYARYNYSVEVKGLTNQRLIDGYYKIHQNIGNNKSVYDIIESALNNTPIKIMERTDEPMLDQEGNIKYDKEGNIIYKQVINPEKTAEANAKIEALKTKFNEWIYSDRTRAKELERIYNDKFNCYVKAKFEGDGLEFNGLDSNINLRKHQKDAIFRSMVQKNILLDHEVGAGKTYAAIAAVMKQKELGLVKKPLIIVPNNLVTQWDQGFFEAFPNANVLVADENSLSPKERDEFLANIANNDWDAVIIKYTQIEKLPVPFETQQKILDNEIYELKEALRYYEERDEVTNKRSARQIEKMIAKTEQKFEKLIEDRTKSKIMDFSMLGVDSIVVDEAHNFKNLGVISPMNAKGKGANISSKRALNMLALTTYINDKDDGKVMFLTGTPVSNSLSEIYNMQRYLQPKELEKLGIDSFSNWASNFAGIDIAPVRDASGRIKMEARFSSLTNLPELSNMLSQTTDTITNDDIKAFSKTFVPNKEVIYIKSEKSKRIAEYIGEPDENGLYPSHSITGRLIHMEGGGYDPKIDNPLKVTSDAKKASIDFRLIDPTAPDYINSKVNIAVDEIFKEWEKWSEQKGTQLVFLEVGTPQSGSEKSFNLKLDENLSREEIKTEYVDEFENINDTIDKNEISINDLDENGEVQIKDDFDDSRFFLYGDIYKKLTQKGIPREQIAFIHDAVSNEEKAELFRKVNNGEVRVLLGSRAKMGTGVNVQKRITALHHIDCPWRPSDITQSNGRAIRQGNIFYENDPENFIIKEFRHITPGTFDERNWELQSKKNEAILNFRKGIVGERSLSGFEEDLLNSNEARAVASENPLIFTEFELNEAIKKEKNEIKRYKEQIFSNADEQEKNNAKIAKLTAQIPKINTIKQVVKQNTKENFTCKINKFQASVAQGGFEAISHEFIILKYKEVDFMKFKDELSKSMFETNQNKNDKSLLFDIAFKNSTSFEAVKEKLESNNNIMQEFKNATLKDYEFKLNGDMQKPVELNFIKDIIKPELDSIEAKQDQMAGMLLGNINLLFAAKDTPREIMEYKGFKVIGTATKTAFEGNVVFFKLVNQEHEIELEPRSLEYHDDKLRGISAREQINLKGFITRINNVLSDEALQKRLEKNTTELKTLQEANATLKEWSENNQTYPKQELFNRLQKDLEICNAENDKMMVDRQYKSEWRSGALEEYKNWDKAQKAKMLEKLKEQNQNIQIPVAQSAIKSAQATIAQREEKSTDKGRGF
ncbi:Cpp14 [Campylobacter hyointestinalis]|uniref:N-6 DNA methylase n=1 Tax=Campylobacter hyointestinalis TaxID=198 RepID=UPI0007247702|nr:N-6 DNA methylase [Campylobacter hyointestinalis]CUU92129.1 Cpp14 [Campylobacter hyointestinalis]